VRYAQAIEDGEKPAGSGACLGHIALAEVIQRFAA
ncbi:MAG: glutathione S-transferase family protein, partial [Mesorhizobium sp.]